MSQHDDLFQELGRTLDVAPSRNFADGVRSRIARRRLVMRTTMSGLAIAASLLLVVVTQWPEPAEPVAMTATAPLIVPSAVAANTATSFAATPTVRAEVEPIAAAPQPRRANQVAPVTEPDPLLVVTNQMAVLQAIWAGHRVTAGETETPPVEVTTIETTPVVIEPVRVLPVVVVGNRAPIEGLPIIRRAVAALETK